MGARIDHLVVAADCLDTGVDYLQQRLGVPFSEGGKHINFGTHNALLRLGSAQYLELIALDPQPAAVAQASWYALHSPELQRRIAVRPRLITWVACTDRLETSGGRYAGPDFICESLTRDQLQWRMCRPADSGLVADGVLPYLIEWETAEHPSKNLPAVGCSLVELTISCPLTSLLSDELMALGLRDTLCIISGQSSGLQAIVQTPSGNVTLD